MISEHLAQSEGMILTVDQVSADNISVSANSATSTTAITATKAGYTPIGVVGWFITSASSSGTNANQVVPNLLRVTSATQVSYVLRNVATGTAKVKLTVYVLYRKISD